MDSSEQKLIREHLAESLKAFSDFVSDPKFEGVVSEFSDIIATAFRGNRKLLIAGNGGSAGDAQHMAGEFISRLFFDHAPLPAIALTTDTSVLTAVGNDYGYEKVFERQVLGLGQPGDVFLGISTSGKSPNIIRALEAARSRKMITLGFAGSKDGPMDALCDAILHAPSPTTAVIQQIHITAVHLICGIVEMRLFPQEHG